MEETFPAKCVPIRLYCTGRKIETHLKRILISALCWLR